jgi:hypothetical protein
MISSRHLHAKRRLSDVSLTTFVHNHHVAVNAMIAVFCGSWFFKIAVTCSAWRQGR